MKIVAVYLRTAQEDPQAIELQKKQVLDAILSKQSKTETPLRTEFFEDNGYSGLNLERPGYAALLRKIEQEEVATVIMTELTRIGRSTVLIYDFVALLQRNGIKLISLQRDYHPARGIARPEALPSR